MKFQLASALLGVLTLSSISSAFASTPVKTYETNQLLLENNSKKHTALDFHILEPTTSIQEIIVFYQPTYVEQFGRDAVQARAEEMVAHLNQIYVSQSVDAVIKVVDVIEVQNVPDTLQFPTKLGETSEDILFRGALFKFSSVAFNPGTFEYDQVVRWQADHVVYLRERRNNDGVILGSGSIGVGFASILDTGTERSLNTFAHEIGHNLRANHEIEDRPNYVIDDGHAFICDNKRTLMYSASNEATTTRIFSTPDESLNGEPCGVDGAANNLRVIKEGVIEAAAWKPGVPTDGQVTLSALSYAGSEGEFVSIGLLRDGDLSNETTVKVYIQSNTAEWGSDYLDTFKLATFRPGEAQTQVNVYVVADNEQEDEETFTVALKYPYRMTLGEQSIAEVTISSRDIAGFMGDFQLSSSADQTTAEGEGISISIDRLGGTNGDVVLQLTSENNSAISGDDYVILNRPILFKDGETQKTFVIETVDDLDIEPTEDFNIKIEAPSAINTTVSELAFTILDNDSISAGNLDLTSLSAVSVREGTSIDAEVRRSGGYMGVIDAMISVNYGGLLPNNSISFSIPEGQETQVISIPIANNNVVQGPVSATFTLTTETPTATIGTSSAVAGIIEDDQEEPTNNAESGSGGGTLGLTWLFLLSIVSVIRLNSGNN